MKKFFLIIAIMAVSAAISSAQDIRVSAGYANSKFINSDLPYDGFFVGLTAEKAFSGAIRFSTGLIYSRVSADQADALTPNTVSINVTEDYFSVPIHAVARIGISRDVFIVLEAGPSFSIGIASNRTVSMSRDADPMSSARVSEKTGDIRAGESASHSLYGDNSNYGRFDIMAGGQAGLEYKRFRIFIGYNYGLFDRDLTESVELHRTETTAGVAFKF